MPRTNKRAGGEKRLGLPLANEQPDEPPLAGDDADEPALLAPSVFVLLPPAAVACEVVE